MARGALVLNAGSSTLKFSLFDLSQPGEPRRVEQGLIERSSDHEQCLKPILAGLRERHPRIRIEIVGHRIVHGGKRYCEPVMAGEAVLADLEALIPLAPLHQPHNLAMVRAVSALFPGCPQMLCFDTAFHHTQPPLAKMFGLPLSYYDEGVRRYGFHGLSYEYIAGELNRRAPSIAAGKVIVAHLGNGVSLCALSAGVSIATTMGFTALDGAPMGTRSGSLDPGVILYLLTEKKMTPDAVGDLLYHGSGLKGISGVSSDMRELLASRQPAARLAIDYFVYRIAREIGSLAAALNGLDGLVFTGGIGANRPEIRTQVCAQLDWLGAALDEASNASGEQCVSTSASRISLWALPTDEELVIARYCARN